MNKNFLWEYKTPGIPDELFNRIDNVPITKEEIRIHNNKQITPKRRMYIHRYWMW